MTRCLNKEQVADILGIKPRTAAVLMLEMNPVAVCGKVRKRYVVTEENLQKWMMRKMLGNKQTIGRTGIGSNRRLERR